MNTASDCQNDKIEAIKVLRRSPDLFNNVKKGQGQLRFIINMFCCMGDAAVSVK